ncbi:hypothetical protein K1719_002091 [Acacia pycnantha]|nr:hypothetical protein K1719_002091 [Acacia pycnantha]
MDEDGWADANGSVFMNLAPFAPPLLYSFRCFLRSGEVAMMEGQGEQLKDGVSTLVLHNEKAKENFNLWSSLPVLQNQRSQISYRNKLLEKEEEASAQELIDQMKEWLCEENEISPALSEEHKTLLDSLPKLSMSDERLMDLCRPWKDALILTVLGKSVNLVMMKDRIAWILRSKSFELIDLPNNYFLFKTGNSDLRLRLLFDGPWVIQGHYLAVQLEYEGLDLICFKCGKYGLSQEKCPLPRDTGEDPLEILQPVATSSNASKNQSCGQAHLKPLVSVPGINSNDEFGSRMIAKRFPRKRIHSVEPKKKEGKLPKNNKSNGKGIKSTSGSIFDMLQDAEDRTYSKGENRPRKSEVATTTWRRKEVSSESGTKEVVVEKEPLNINTDGKCPLVIGEPRLEPSSERDLKEQVAEVKEREHTTINVSVDQPVFLKQTAHDYNLRPNGLSSLHNKKNTTRAHSVIFGSTKTIESSKASEPKVQAGGKKKKSCKEKETGPDIVDSPTTTNLIEVVVRGEEDSDGTICFGLHPKLDPCGVSGCGAPRGRITGGAVARRNCENGQRLSLNPDGRPSPTASVNGCPVDIQSMALSDP